MNNRVASISSSGIDPRYYVIFSQRLCFGCRLLRIDCLTWVGLPPNNVSWKPIVFAIEEIKSFEKYLHEFHCLKLFLSRR